MWRWSHCFGFSRRWSRIFWLLLGVSGLPRVPTFNHSPYGLTLLSSLLADLHSLTSWPTLTHAKHQPTSLSYRKATLASSPFGLTTGPPRLSGFSSGTSTLIRRKRAWSVLRALQSTSMTLPSPCPISCAASSVIKSNGSPQTWTQIGMWVKVTERAVIPFSHLRKTRIWLSKHQGLLFQTQFSWHSIENLNCSRPSSSSTIFKSSPIFHIDLSKFLATLILIGLVVRNLPIKLKEYSSRISFLLNGRTYCNGFMFIHRKLHPLNAVHYFRVHGVVSCDTAKALWVQSSKLRVLLD